MSAGTEDIIVAGGGASGLAACLYAAGYGLSVLCLEKNDVPGKKLSMTGNGRGNLSNLHMDVSCYNEGARSFLSSLIGPQATEETVRFFREAGVLLRNEEGYLYPVAGVAKEVTDALIAACVKKGVRFLCNRQVKSIRKEGAYFEVKDPRETHRARCVILATGGLAGPRSTGSSGDGYYLAKQLGMEVTPRYPALVRLLTAEETVSSEKGVRVRATVSFYAGEELFARETGEVQITSKALSGIPVLQASGEAARHLAEGRDVTARIDCFPDVAQADFLSMCGERTEKAREGTLADLLRGFAHPSLCRAVLTAEGMSGEDKTRAVPGDKLLALLCTFRAFPVRIRAADSYLQAQTTAGGVRLSDLTPQLAARKTPGVYVTGELCDVDGRCGGYNLQWAFTSAKTAVDDIARILKNDKS
ncbi:MAG: aminoacetone oxidase family FAD-binding enzyme [Lachnospiraceae bacterium]|nr:aminoacetone oxidase family FAD-binding enzyme [Lachnospiraceae bacterium]